MTEHSNGSARGFPLKNLSLYRTSPGFVERPQQCSPTYSQRNSQRAQEGSRPTQCLATKRMNTALHERKPRKDQNEVPNKLVFDYVRQLQGLGERAPGRQTSILLRNCQCAFLKSMKNYDSGNRRRCPSSHAKKAWHLIFDVSIKVTLKNKNFRQVFM